MQCYTELAPPTAISHAVSASLTRPNSNDLVVARTSVLQVFTYKIIQDELDTDPQRRVAANISGQMIDRRLLENGELDPTLLSQETAAQWSEQRQLTKLVLVAEYHLSGTICSLARVKLQSSKTGGDALLVACREAKLSLVEWDPGRHGLSTMSIHYFEREELERSPFAPDMHHCATYLTVDPRGKCVAMKFGNRNLAILPFRQAGDDLAMDDYDSDIDGERFDIDLSKPSNGDATSSEPPYTPSFVLPLTALDPGLVHLIHLAFLHEYRGPTFGVLSCSIALPVSRLHEQRDVLAYTVFTLDMEQRASTTILSVTGLPFDLYKVIALPPPVGGSLLVGFNELVHVDQAGRTNAVAVNPFARECSSFSMADQSELALKLEDCAIEQMDAKNSNMLMILRTGELAVLNFKLDGRTVSGLSIRKVLPRDGGLILKGSPSCTVSMTGKTIFVGSEDGDSTLLGWTHQSDTLKQRRQSGVASDLPMDEEPNEEDMDDYDDDLYSGSDPVLKANNATQIADTSLERRAAGDYSFQAHDSLRNIAPIQDVTFGYPISSKSDRNKNSQQLEMMVASGRGRAGGISRIRRELDSEIVGRFDFPNVQGIWSVRAKRPVPKAIASQAPEKTAFQLTKDFGNDQEFDRFLIVSRTDSEGSDVSAIYAVTSTGFREMKDTEFEPAAGDTVDVGVLCSGTRIVQVLRSEIRSYDGGMCSLSTDARSYIPWLGSLSAPLFRCSSVHFDSSSALCLSDRATHDIKEILPRYWQLLFSNLKETARFSLHGILFLCLRTLLLEKLYLKPRLESDIVKSLRGMQSIVYALVHIYLPAETHAHSVG